MGRPKKGTPRIVPSCHPEKKHQAFGLCATCYRRNYTVERRKTDPLFDRYRGWDYHLKRRYGITVDDYNRMLASQDGHCALCTLYPDATHERFCVDHDHITGKIRGILCKFCNSKLGWYEARKTQIARYLDNHTCQGV